MENRLFRWIDISKLCKTQHSWHMTSGESIFDLCWLLWLLEIYLCLSFCRQWKEFEMRRRKEAEERTKKPATIEQFSRFPQSNPQIKRTKNSIQRLLVLFEYQRDSFLYRVFFGFTAEWVGILFFVRRESCSRDVNFDLRRSE